MRERRLALGLGELCPGLGILTQWVCLPMSCSSDPGHRELTACSQWGHWEREVEGPDVGFPVSLAG